MKKKKFFNSYNEYTAKQYIDNDTPIINVSSELEIQYNWVDKKRTDEIIGYKLYFSQSGLNPFSVKFSEKPFLPPFLAQVKLDNLEAIEVNSNIYFRAAGIEVIK